MEAVGSGACGECAEERGLYSGVPRHVVEWSRLRSRAIKAGRGAPGPRYITARGTVVYGGTALGAREYLVGLRGSAPGALCACEMGGGDYMVFFRGSRLGSQIQARSEEEAVASASRAVSADSVDAAEGGAPRLWELSPRADALDPPYLLLDGPARPGTRRL